MTVLNTGSTKKYSANWEQIFSGRSSQKTAGKAKPATAKSAAKKATAKAKKVAGKAKPKK